jgi:hypothetical protein
MKPPFLCQSVPLKPVTGAHVSEARSLATHFYPLVQIGHKAANAEIRLAARLSASGRGVA